MVLLLAIILVLSQFLGINTLEVGFVTLKLGVVLGSILFGIGIIWLTILYNFMDGSDGLAGTQAVFVFAFGGLFLWLTGNYALAISAWVVVALSLAFLVWNWPPAKIFMGDVGSMFYGLLIALYAVSGEQWGNVPLLLWLMLCMPFCIDASITVMRRLYFAEPITEPHQSHAFQRLLKSGWTHQKLLYAYAVILMGISGLTYWVFYHQTYLLLGFCTDMLFCLLLYQWVEKKYPMFRQSYVKNL